MLILGCILFGIPGLAIISGLGGLIVGPRKAGVWRRRYAAWNVQNCCWLFCKLFSIRVTVKGNLDLLKTHGPYLVVANHFGYVDVWVLSGLFKTLFITSVEVRDTPVLGLTCKAAGCYFVERRNPRQVGDEIKSFSEALEAGPHLTLFPEGTSSNGDGVLPFKKSLFELAVRARATVLPICIRYRKADGRPLNRENRDSVFYYGDMTFGDHFPRLTQVGPLEVEVEILEPEPITESTDRKILADLVRQKIVTAYGAPTF